MAVGAGGFLGAMGRCLIGDIVSRFWRGNFPLGTFIVNMLGSFALGLIVGHPGLAAFLLHGSVPLALGVGFLGSFTTFSTLMYEGFMMDRNHQPWMGLFYIMASMVVGLLLAWFTLLH